MDKRGAAVVAMGFGLVLGTAWACGPGPGLVPIDTGEPAWDRGPLWGASYATDACDEAGSSAMTGWGWSDPGQGLGKRGPGAVPIVVEGLDDISGPERIAGGQLYAVSFHLALEPGASLAMRVKWPRTWRFAATADVPIALYPINVNCERRDNPHPVARRVFAGSPFVAAYEVDLLAGWYFVRFDRANPPALRFLAEPVGPPR